MNAIATYSEKKFRIIRTFELYPDRVKIAGRTTDGGRFECEVHLDYIRLPKATAWINDTHRISFFAIPFTLALLGIALFGAPVYKFSPLLFWAAIVFCLLGIVLPFFLVKKAKYYHYSTTAGVPAFDLGQIGRTEQELESFSQLLDEQVRKMTGQPPQL